MSLSQLQTFCPKPQRQCLVIKAEVYVNINLFEKTARIGGRTLTINPFNDPAHRVEQGASIFVLANYIPYESMTEFGFSPKLCAPALWNNLKVILEYGLTSPQRAQDLVNATFTKFLRLYEPQFLPFESLTQRVQELDLFDNVTGVTGEQFLRDSGVGNRFAHDMIQSATRVNYASKFARIHGLTAILSLAGQGALSVQSGNWQIFHEMVQRPGATPSGSQYTVQTTSGSHPAAFDNVIIANPYQFSGISAGEGSLQTSIAQVPYVQLHVTTFTSSNRFNPGFFDLPNSAQAPLTILTTLARSDTPTSGVDGAGKAGFFSMMAIKSAANPQSQRDRLLGATVPSTFTGANSPISWYAPQVFYAYPKTSPRTTFQDPIVGSRVYYMSTNALMGKNVARRIVDDMTA
ncbi:hypothetical protein N657DRAFT_659193 [Parathielavia appendiculata]|uniref:Prenylcysteine lyase domain-containing protein n=1 Tax=Parathielavia appendiculata TaxID=2587402 RepID=A0AAN6TR07_9PEZI|nr:hypothetical protein N657DRAFT_659193 [Parathielavia appendiculata]